MYAWFFYQPTEAIVVGHDKLEKYENIRSFKLLNARTGELLELTSTFEELNAIVAILVENFFRGKKIHSFK